MQKERGASRILSLHEEIEREAREIEKEMSRHPELDNIQVTEEMDAALLKKIQAYEQDLEEEREAVKKVEENLRKNHYLSASAEDSVHASTANAAGHAGKHTGAGAVRRFKVPGDSVEFAAELMPEIPRGFVLGNRDAGDVRDSRKIGARETAAGYVGYMGPKAPGYGESMQASVSAYGDNMETTVCGYRDNIEGTVSGYRGNMEETASGYRENMEETASGYRGNIEAAAGYRENIEAAGAENVVEWPKDEYVAEPGDVTGNVAGSAAEGVGEEKVLYRRKKKKYILVSLAAVLLIVLGVGGTSVGSKSHWKVLWERVTRGESLNVINTEDMDSYESGRNDEIEAYSEIEDKFHIHPVRMEYKPEGMKLDDYEIQEKILRAQLLYGYKGEVIRFFLYMNDEDSSIGQNEEDSKIDEYMVTVDGVEIKVVEFEKPKNSRYRQEAYFEYKGVHYQLKGVMEREEFEKILENLYFF